MMIVLPEAQKDRVRHFFLGQRPSKVWLDGYFQNRLPGVTYVDSLVAPRVSIVVTEFHHIAFVGWEGSPRDFSKELASVLSQEVDMGLLWDGKVPVAYPTQNLTGQFSRLEFGTFAPTNDWNPGDGISDGDLEISELDRLNFNQCESRSECLYAYETRERFLAECFGFVATRNGSYVGNAEAICQSVDEEGNASADLQIVVAEGFRRRGFGLKLARVLIEELMCRGIRPIWSCNKDNIASEALARKLGFRDPVEFQVISYAIEPGLQKYWVTVLDRFGLTDENREEVVRRLQNEFELNRRDAHWLVVNYLREREQQSEDRGGDEEPIQAVEIAMRSVRPELGSILHFQSYRPTYRLFPARVTIQRKDGATQTEVLKTANTKDSLQFEVKILEMVREVGLPVPQVLSPIFPFDHAGTTVWAVALEAIEGTPPEWLGLDHLGLADKTCKLVIEGIKRLHQLTAVLARMDTSNLLPRRELADEFRLIKASSSPWLHDPVVSRALELLETRLAGISVPLVFSNGDYNPLNFLVRDGELVGWIDFEHACFEDPSIGLVKFLLWADDEWGWAAGAKSGLVERFLFQENVRPFDFYCRVLLRAVFHIQGKAIDDRPSHMLAVVEEYTKKILLIND